MIILLRVLAVCLVMSIANAAEARRVALIIGNDHYTSLKGLDNPISDASELSNLLRSNHFEVFFYQDMRRADLLDALDKFRADAASADVALIYYAGHGLEVSGKNIIAPIDMEISCSQHLAMRAVELDKLFETIQDVPQQIVILDACRNDPFPQCPARGSSGGGFRGFDVVAIGARVLVVNSTLSGRTASDGPFGGHSPFAAALVSELRTNPTVSIRNALDDVARKVALDTNGAQTPEVTTRGGAPDACLSEPDCGGSSVNGPAGKEIAGASGASSSGCNGDLDYQDALSKNTSDGYRLFLEKCPNDRRTDTVRGLYAQLADEAMWESVSKANTLGAYLQYLVAFPQGIYAGKAKQRRDELESAAPGQVSTGEVVATPEIRGTSPPGLVAVVSQGSWATGNSDNCGNPSKVYSMTSNADNITWHNGVGNTDVEKLVSNSDSEFRTETIKSLHTTGAGERVGQIWTYSKLGTHRIQVKPLGKSSFMLVQCEE